QFQHPPTAHGSDMNCAVDVWSDRSVCRDLGGKFAGLRRDQFESVLVVDLKQIGIQSDFGLGRRSLGIATARETANKCNEQSCHEQNAFRNDGIHGITSCPTLKFSWF